ncbi:MAG: TetR/AcrR family transcriptional regulator, partial [Polyangiales bacterium]
MPKKAKKDGYHHGDLRRTLLSAAVSVVEKEGVSALSLHALAKRAGVSSAAPYHHFASREALLAAIAAEGFVLLADFMKKESQGTTDARARLEALGRGYVRFALAHRGHFRVMFRAELREVADQAMIDAGNVAYGMLTDAVSECQREGYAPAGDPMPLVLLAWSSVHGASSLFIDG